MHVHRFKGSSLSFPTRFKFWKSSVNFCSNPEICAKVKKQFLSNKTSLKDSTKIAFLFQRRKATECIFMLFLLRILLIFMPYMRKKPKIFGPRGFWSWKISTFEFYFSTFSFQKYRTGDQALSTFFIKYIFQ